MMRSKTHSRHRDPDEDTLAKLAGILGVTDQLALKFAQTMPERFEEFHNENPNVYATLVRLAREWVASTAATSSASQPFSSGPLGNRTRHQRPRLQAQQQPRAYYARLIMRQEPDLADLFDLRASEADEWIERRAS
ncbi:gp63 domain protein [Mycobacterium xenopi 3993]|nr:gp63 domain protein [Mycobacterium xenopi 3993]